MKVVNRHVSRSVHQNSVTPLDEINGENAIDFLIYRL